MIVCTDSGPVPVTPDYGGPVVCYADGVFDKTSNRYVTVREGMWSISTFMCHSNH